MGYVQFWILIALLAAAVVLIGASVATKRLENTTSSPSTWSGLWRNLTDAWAPMTHRAKVGALKVMTALRLVRDPQKLAQAKVRRDQVIQARKVDKIVTDLAGLDAGLEESNISLEDFLVATQVDEPAYINVVSPERADELYERYATRK